MGWLGWVYGGRPLNHMTKNAKSLKPFRQLFKTNRNSRKKTNDKKSCTSPQIAIKNDIHTHLVRERMFVCQGV